MLIELGLGSVMCQAALSVPAEMLGPLKVDQVPTMDNCTTHMKLVLLPQEILMNAEMTMVAIMETMGMEITPIAELMESVIFTFNPNLNPLGLTDPIGPLGPINPADHLDLTDLSEKVQL